MKSPLSALGGASSRFSNRFFLQAEQSLQDDGYIKRVMARVEKRRRNVLREWPASVAPLVFFELLVSARLQNTIDVITQASGATLLELENERTARALAPLNCIAGQIGILLAGMQFLY